MLRRSSSHEPKYAEASCVSVDVIYGFDMNDHYHGGDRHDREQDADPTQENGRLRFIYESLLLGTRETADSEDEPFFVDNLRRKDQTSLLSLEEENDYFRDMILWEQAPSLELKTFVAKYLPLIDLQKATDAEVERSLSKLVRFLNSIGHRIVCADHLSARRVYSLIVNGVLPHQIKVLPPEMFTEWFFCFHTETEILDKNDFTIYFQYYAEDFEHIFWREEDDIPKRIATPYSRPYMPKHRPIFTL